MARPGWGAAVWALVLGACACEQIGSTAVRVLPTDDGGDGHPTGHARIVSSEAALTEDPSRVGSGTERIGLTVDIANVGQVGVDRVVARDGRVAWMGLALATDFLLDPAPPSDAAPIAPGETRRVRFAADVIPLGVCTAQVMETVNPHHGLVTIGLTVVSSAGAWAMAGVDAAVTCLGPAPADGQADGGDGRGAADARRPPSRPLDGGAPSVVP